MPTFVVYMRRTRGALARLVLMLHRRVVSIESISFEQIENTNTTRTTVVLDTDAHMSRLVEANLYKLFDVLQVESSQQECANGLQNADGTRSQSMKAIYIVTTGGTIEKVYSERSGTVANVASKIDRYLKLLRLPNSGLSIVSLMNIDSLEMTDSDRALILGTVKAILPEQAPVVITHGTDTMVETGLYLQRNLPELKIPIVLTGAMTPLGFEGSDGLQNLTESLFAVRVLSPGIYVVCHGDVFPVCKVRKDPVLGRFVWTEERFS
jgi:L-asparaginase